MKLCTIRHELLLNTIHTLSEGGREHHKTQNGFLSRRIHWRHWTYFAHFKQCVGIKQPIIQTNKLDIHSTDTDGNFYLLDWSRTTWKIFFKCKYEMSKYATSMFTWYIYQINFPFFPTDRHKFINVCVYVMCCTETIYQDSGVGLTSRMQNYWNINGLSDHV